MPIQHHSQSSNLLEVLEKILDKGVVIAGDIKIALADVDLLTIKIRLLVASVDKAREIGMDWWENDPYYSSKGKIAEKENAILLERMNRLEELVEAKALPQEKLLLEVSEEKKQPNEKVLIETAEEKVMLNHEGQSVTAKNSKIDEKGKQKKKHKRKKK